MAKQQSNAASTGGAGFIFESRVQASFVTLMLTGGRVPVLPSWPVHEIRVQASIYGYQTDDVVLVVKDPQSQNKAKLLGQMKRSISFSPSDISLKETLEAAWLDYNNANIFNKGVDSIALITGPLSKNDYISINWLLDYAKSSVDAEDFLLKLNTANFSPASAPSKLNVLKMHLKYANNDVNLSDDELLDFLKHFHVIGYDLEREQGVALTLIHSHLSQFDQVSPKAIWSRIYEEVQRHNKQASIITYDRLPDDLKELFKAKPSLTLPSDFEHKAIAATPSISDYPKVNFASMISLIGSWDENNESDRDVISQFSGLAYENWLRACKEILNLPSSPLRVKNGVWSIRDREEYLQTFCETLLDKDLDLLHSIAVTILGEIDPAFDLSSEERYLAGVKGKVLSYSQPLRNGISEALALLKENESLLINCSRSKVRNICDETVSNLLSSSDFRLWGSLKSQLSSLSECAPRAFIRHLEEAFESSEAPIPRLIAQEGSSFTSQSYLTGILWALEVIAWDQKTFMKALYLIAELAEIEPQRRGNKRAVNSLVSILLPWYPQTLANTNQREAAIESINNFPDVAWNVLIQLLPDQHRSTTGTAKPKWSKVITEDFKPVVRKADYARQANALSKKAVEFAALDLDISKVSKLISLFGNLTNDARIDLLTLLQSERISSLNDEGRHAIWSAVGKLLQHHRNFPDAEWSLPEDSLSMIESAVTHLSPKDPRYKYRDLFSSPDFDLLPYSLDWETREKKLLEMRKEASFEIYDQFGTEGLIEFAKETKAGRLIGYSLGNLDWDFTNDLHQPISPKFFLLDGAKREVAEGFARACHQTESCHWNDRVLDSEYPMLVKARLLLSLPFSPKTWERVESCLDDISDYWRECSVKPHEAADNLDVAVTHLLSFQRPVAAAGCMTFMIRQEMEPDTKLVFEALEKIAASNEPQNQMTAYNITDLIKRLQNTQDVDEARLAKVEFQYLEILDGHYGATPTTLFKSIAESPQVFWDLIRTVYRSSNETDQPPLNESQKRMASQMWGLLNAWNLVPGTTTDGEFDGEKLKEWVESAIQYCTESGHLDVALNEIGQVLFYAPADPSGTWIHHDVAGVLNERMNEPMRRGFKLGALNSRGAHILDPTGAPELQLENDYRSKAEKMDLLGVLGTSPQTVA